MILWETKTEREREKVQQCFRQALRTTHDRQTRFTFSNYNANRWFLAFPKNCSLLNTSTLHIVSRQFCTMFILTLKRSQIDTSLVKSRCCCSERRNWNGKVNAYESQDSGWLFQWNTPPIISALWSHMHGTLETVMLSSETRLSCSIRCLHTGTFSRWAQWIL